MMQIWENEEGLEANELQSIREMTKAKDPAILEACTLYLVSFFIYPLKLIGIKKWRLSNFLIFLSSDRKIQKLFLRLYSSPLS